jgi:hypothetical protein
MPIYSFNVKWLNPRIGILDFDPENIWILWQDGKLIMYFR